MPHSMRPPDNDDSIIADLINPGAGGDNLEFLNRELIPGEKADDAVDYEDVELDDLPEEEEDIGDIDGDGVGLNGTLQNDAEDVGSGELDELPTANGAAGFDADFDDLFGDVPSSPTGAAGTSQDGGASLPSLDSHQQPASSTTQLPTSSASQTQVSSSAPTLTADVVDEETDPEYARQLAELRIPPPPPETAEEALAAMYPKYRKDEIPRWVELMPPKRFHYQGKTPLKPPKPVQPTKISLDVTPDQEREFRSAAPALQRKRKLVQNGIIQIAEDASSSEVSEEEIDTGTGFEGEVIGGVTWNDLETLCQDWDIDILEASSDDGLVELEGPPIRDDDLFDDADAEWDREFALPPPKRVKHGRPVKDLFAQPVFSIPSFDDPERATAKIAKKVILDMNDPRLLLDRNVSALNRTADVGLESKSRLSGILTKDMSRRYNISNDEAYELLKENHQSKVRSTLGNLTVQHSLPALRLQYPYYKVKLATREARSFHRPAMSFQPNVPVRFSKRKTIKRKDQRQKETQEIYRSTRDLSLMDNSSALLLEYSEEYPTMMSNFGMGSRLINYYRRKDMQDHARPKLDVGETAILLPQDKSPFYGFGDVDPGDIVPALYNEMFRAPLFRQSTKPTDFLVIRNTTGVDGSSWYMRTIENLYVVGQEFPSVDVPGPHSRKVTTAAKNRLKMISYRKISRDPNQRIAVHEVTEHFPDTTDIQNRQKLKEFLHYNKDHKEWELKTGESVPDSVTLRRMVRPEDVCLLESAQVGSRHLLDAGYGKDDASTEDEEGGEGQSLDQQLAPWYTTRNFLQATQGKAMLKLHGEGDPSGRGEAFSFIKTSMKGGFRAEGESAADKMDAKRSKENGGHSYNVARQQKAYQDAIRRIWDAQKASLSSTVDHSEEMEADDDVGDAPEDLFDEGRTPRSEAPTPAALTHRGDDEQSLFSKMSTSSQKGRLLRITRQKKLRGGKIEKNTEVIKDPRVMREYLKRRHAREAERLALSEITPTGNAEEDQRNQKRIQEELNRLQRNKDRRLARNKQKGIDQDDDGGSPHDAGSPSTVPAVKTGGTGRKCQNCGQVGHIRTNKKLCPLYNGNLPGLEAAIDEGFGSVGTPSTTF